MRWRGEVLFHRGLDFGARSRVEQESSAINLIKLRIQDFNLKMLNLLQGRPVRSTL